MATAAQQKTISVSKAMDLVDAYGPDPMLWPYQMRPALEQLLSDNEDFADYVAEAREFDAMLGNWEWADDGAEFADDRQDGDSFDNDADDDDSDDTPPPPSPSDDEDEGEDDYNDGTFGARGPQAGADDKPLSHEEMPNIDVEDLQDMDEMLSKFILESFKDSSDEEFRVFTRDFDAVTPIVVPHGVSIDPIEQAVAKSTGPLIKELRRLIAARTESRRLPGRRNGRLHSPNLHRIMSGDDRVFYRKEEAPALDTAISLVLDCSGSMAGTRMKLAVETAYALATVLNRLDVPFECLGFTDNYSDPRIQTKEYQQELRAAGEVTPIARYGPLSMPKFKEFGERWNQATQTRFAHIFNQQGGYNCGFNFGSTPEPCGVEFAARRLVARSEKRKIMIVMTDGEPYSPTFNAPSNIFQAQAHKMARMVAASGIDIVGIGIQHAGPQRYYPNSIVINQLEEMPKELLGMLKKFMVG